MGDNPDVAIGDCFEIKREDAWYSAREIKSEMDVKYTVAQCRRFPKTRRVTRNGQVVYPRRS
jgi:hypothetical protein